MNYRLQEKIDASYSGRMDPEESLSFERELKNDPSLMSEANFQKEIVEGLKAYRKSQLKDRLNAIDVAPTWIEFAQQSTLLKSFGGVAIATAVGAGVYFYAEPKKEEVTSVEVKIEAPFDEAKDFDWLIMPADLDDQKVAALVAKPSESLSTKKEITVPQVEENEDTNEFVPSFEAPEAGKVEDEEALGTSSLEVLPENQTSAPLEEAIDVSTEITRSIDVKYKYYDGKLFLSGDFDRAPYEILEINSASGRRIYVKYLGKYYQVAITDRLSDLPEVKDDEVIKELKLLRQHK